MQLNYLFESVQEQKEENMFTVLCRSSLHLCGTESRSLRWNKFLPFTCFSYQSLSSLPYYNLQQLTAARRAARKIKIRVKKRRGIAAPNG